VNERQPLQSEGRVTIVQELAQALRIVHRIALGKGVGSVDADAQAVLAV